MRTLPTCPVMPADGIEKDSTTTGVPKVEALIDFIHGTAVHVEWLNGQWLNFDEFGKVFSNSVGVGEGAVAEARKLLPDMEEVRRQRREFRSLFIKEAEQVKTDDRIGRLSDRHSTNWSSPSLTRRMIQEVTNLGYQTAKVWSPYCRQDGCDTYGWILYPKSDDVLTAERMNREQI